MGMGLGPIPWTVVQQYIRVEQLDDDEADTLEYCIRYLDDVYLRELNKDGNRKTHSSNHSR